MSAWPSRFLGVSSDTGIYIGQAIVFLYAVFGGMKGITYTQVAQYIVLIAAYLVPAFFILAAAHRQPAAAARPRSTMAGTDVSLPPNSTCS